MAGGAPVQAEEPVVFAAGPGSQFGDQCEATANRLGVCPVEPCRGIKKTLMTSAAFDGKTPAPLTAAQFGGTPAAGAGAAVPDAAGGYGQYKAGGKPAAGQAPADKAPRGQPPAAGQYEAGGAPAAAGQYEAGGAPATEQSAGEKPAAGKPVAGKPTDGTKPAGQPSAAGQYEAGGAPPRGAPAGGAPAPAGAHAPAKAAGQQPAAGKAPGQPPPAGPYEAGGAPAGGKPTGVAPTGGRPTGGKPAPAGAPRPAATPNLVAPPPFEAEGDANLGHLSVDGLAVLDIRSGTVSVPSAQLLSAGVAASSTATLIAVVRGPANYVEFYVNGAWAATESYSPYAITGNNGGAFPPWPPLATGGTSVSVKVLAYDVARNRAERTFQIAIKP